MQEKMLVIFIVFTTKTNWAEAVKACLKRCSFRALKCTWSFVSSLTTEMSQILYVEFPCGLTISSNLCLNRNRDLEFLVSSSSKFHLNIAL